MTEQAWWVVAIVAVVVFATIGFFIGRQTAANKTRVDELEAELGRQIEELARYRNNVDAHFEQTAGLFVSMAGSYKALFEHLASGYDTLAPGGGRDLFKEKVAALLLDAPGRTERDAAAGTEARDPESSTPEVSLQKSGDSDAAGAGADKPATTVEADESATPAAPPAVPSAEVSAAQPVAADTSAPAPSSPSEESGSHSPEPVSERPDAAESSGPAAATAPEPGVEPAPQVDAGAPPDQGAVDLNKPKA